MIEIKKIFKKAQELGSCDRFTGNENFRELVALLFSSQGIEFCIKNKFPDVKYFEQFDSKLLSENGIFLNAGTIEIENKENVLIVGRTFAIAKYNSLEHTHNLFSLHGAEAVVYADNYSVVVLHGDKKNFETKKTNNAIIL